MFPMMDFGAKLAKVTVKLALSHHTIVLPASIVEISTYIIITALLYAHQIPTKMSLINAETVLRVVSHVII